MQILRNTLQILHHFLISLTAPKYYPLWMSHLWAFRISGMAFEIITKWWGCKLWVIYELPLNHPCFHSLPLSKNLKFLISGNPPRHSGFSLGPLWFAPEKLLTVKRNDWSEKRLEELSSDSEGIKLPVILNLIQDPGFCKKEGMPNWIRHDETPRG